MDKVTINKEINNDDDDYNNDDDDGDGDGNDDDGQTQAISSSFDRSGRHPQASLYTKGFGTKCSECLDCEIKDWKDLCICLNLFSFLKFLNCFIGYENGNNRNCKKIVRG